MEIEWTDENKALMTSTGHVLCLGGPGSGKTTISLLKANDEIAKAVLRSGQRVLFLSFARATIARVEEHAETFLKSETRKYLEISTYHGFTWSILRSHGYLLTSATPITLLPPAESAAALSEIVSDDDKLAEKKRLFIEDGRLDFDLFAGLTAELLSRSTSLRRLVSETYPIIILDEFQDTDANEWELIKALGIDSRLIALADPEQRIYEFRGASPTRIPEFIEAFSPTEIDFTNTNHRSAGTDICLFGNDLLTGVNKAKTYEHVEIIKYPFRRPPGDHLDLKITVLKRRKAILESNPDSWSLAILVPTKKLMLEVSEYLATKQEFNNGKVAPEIDNEAMLDAEGPALAAVTIAGLLSAEGTAVDISQRLITDLCRHIRGRKGGAKPSQQQLSLAGGLEAFVDTGNLRGPKRKAIAEECLAISEQRLQLVMSGDPGKDWLQVRSLFSNASAPDLQNVANDARFLKFLNRGTQLRSRLAEIWRTTGTYTGAGSAVDVALTREHFAAASQTFQGIHVMTLHKSKGKQFTEVIVYEGPAKYRDKIVRPNGTEQDVARGKLILRVGVTRAERFTSILSPANQPCPLI
ncbi:ATP-dependent helicase [Seongchinamella sediminis]|uniref:DNA 3'-5' helicase II n=1 Tax=Seongchinamella sediminis TaxID=2283635 RepID=A0A3L7E1P0_9GAMM|nr:UvrD-helicase domain-containing protein [Seongchinamella sediminis]RLQ22600.1 ATP-dependent helicase [Seongchinamella sediminis]